VTVADPRHSDNHHRFQLQGWLISIFLHGTILFAVVLGVQRIQLAPQETAFQWDVALVPAPQTVAPVTPIQNPTPARSAPSTPPALVTPAESLQPPPAHQPPVQQPAPSPSERNTAPVITEHPVSPPAQPTATQPSTIQPESPTKPVTTETVAPASTEAPHIDRPAVIPAQPPTPAIVPVPPPSAPPSAPPSISESKAQPDQMPTQTADTAPTTAIAPTKQDYGWLSEAILRRVEELKRYPAAARIDRAEGRVVVKAVINEDGSVGDVEIFKSSGYPILDKAAIETIRQAAPFQLLHPLNRPRLTVKIPISYRLDR